MDSFSSDGLTFDVRDFGPADGTPVVCLHGFPQNGHSYDAVAARLAEQGLRVLVPDQRGYSPGARPDDVRAYALGELVGDVLALLDAAGLEAAHVVGHDWGGAMAWAAAGRFPQRVRTLTALSTPHPAAMMTHAVRTTQAFRSAYMAFFQVPRLPEAVLLAGGGTVLRTLLTRTGLPTSHASGYVARMQEPRAMTSALAWYRAMRVAGRAGPGTGTVTVPTTYVRGGRGVVFAPAAARATARYVRGPYTERVLDAGHWLPETRPAQVTATVLEQIRRSGG